MEYRLRVASEEECLEWAKELWQLELVAKARGYTKKWAVQTSRNRLMWREAFAARDECRAPDFEQFRGTERVISLGESLSWVLPRVMCGSRALPRVK
jgi:hypothetical protein